MIRYYVLIISGGVEIDQDGPFNSEDERDDRARLLWKDMNVTNDNLFRLDVDHTGEVHTGVYVGGELDE